MAYSQRVNGAISGPAATVPDVRGIRERLGLSQAQLASYLNVSKRTLENWEQRRRGPSGAARTLLWIMQREPHAVRRALRPGAVR